MIGMRRFLSFVVATKVIGRRKYERVKIETSEK